MFQAVQITFGDCYPAPACRLERAIVLSANASRARLGARALYLALATCIASSVEGQRPLPTCSSISCTTHALEVRLTAGLRRRWTFISVEAETAAILEALLTPLAVSSLVPRIVSDASSMIGGVEWFGGWNGGAVITFACKCLGGRSKVTT